MECKQVGSSPCLPILPGAPHLYLPAQGRFCIIGSINESGLISKINYD
jgi:hypothetical protein